MQTSHAEGALLTKAREMGVRIRNEEPLADVATNEDPFLDFLAAQGDGWHVPELVKDWYRTDPFFAKILKETKWFKNFKVSGGLVILLDNGVERLCIPNVKISKRSVREVVISHAHSLLLHLGSLKTLNLLRNHVWWKFMSRDVQKYCKTCMTCKQSKLDNQRPYGLLNSLPVLNSPWEAIGIDFVGLLPSSSMWDSSYDAITVIIDLLTTMVYLCPAAQRIQQRKWQNLSLTRYTNIINCHV